MGNEEIQLKIDVFVPQTLPMLRLAEYLKPFALMLGSEDNVHFSHIVSGSAGLLAYVDTPAIPKIKARVQALVDGTAPSPAAKAFAEVDRLLIEDNAVAEMRIGDTKVIEFPGRRRAPAEQIGPVPRDGSIDGQIFSIGGKDETVNVRLRDGEKEFRCVVSVDVARRLAPHLLAGKLRLFGRGNWYRVDSAWQMRTFIATDFVPLDDSAFSATLGVIQKIFEGVPPDEFMSAMSELREE